MTMARTIKLYKLPEVRFSDQFKKYSILKEPLTPGIRPMVESDSNQVQKLLSKYMLQFPLAPTINKDEVKHWLLPRKDVVYSYVVEV
jgi:glycylpeptide N-tetradecanoyltransferase